MRLQNLDEITIGRIEQFLDPVSRLNFLIALKQNSRKPWPKPKKKKQHKYYCFFCALNVYYFDIAMQFGVGEENRSNIIFHMLHKFESRKVEKGDDLNPYLITKYRRRHYSKKEDEREISHFMNYHGKFSKFDFNFSCHFYLNTFKIKNWPWLIQQIALDDLYTICEDIKKFTFFHRL